MGDLAFWGIVEHLALFFLNNVTALSETWLIGIKTNPVAGFGKLN